MTPPAGRRDTALIFLVAVLLALGCNTLAAATPAAAAILQFVGDHPLPGRATRWDYISLYGPRFRLFIAHLGDSAVVVVDTKTKAVVATIADVSDVHGVLAIPRLDRVYASATGTNEVVAIDAATLKIVARIPAGNYPDGMAYAPDAHKLYVSDEHGRTATVIDVRSNQRVATIGLGGEVGNIQYDPVSRHIFVNVQGTKELVEINPATDAMVTRTMLPGADGNHGLLIDPALQLAFIACEGNDQLIVVNLDTRKIVGRFNVGGGPDVLGYDAGSGVLLVASESGVVSRFQVNASGMRKVGDAKVGTNAHTLAVDPATHEVYFPVNETGKGPVLRVMRP
jgi:YVTN family beta-propeller protein